MRATHQQIDQDFIDRGVFTREQIDEMRNEYQDTLSDLLNTQQRAKSFLKRRMGLLQYFFWRMLAGYRWITFGKDSPIEKAKRYGFKSKW